MTDRLRTGAGVPGPVSCAPRWGRVQEIFSQAVDLPENDRVAFVQSAAEGDGVLAHEVLSLLRAHVKEGPLEALQARLPTLRLRPSVADLEGQQVLHYDLVEKLDGGGMSVVYKAQDRRLGRAVALKFLLPQLLDEGDAKERFLFEAKAAASLDHPNVCTIHEVGETEGGLLFIAMAYYEGEVASPESAPGSDPRRRGADDCVADLSGSGEGRGARDHPPGHQAGQRHVRRGWDGEDRRLRTRQGSRRGADQERRSDGHRRLHEPRAGPGRGTRSADGHLVHGGRVVSDAVGPAAVHGPHGPRDHPGHPR